MRSRCCRSPPRAVFPTASRAVLRATRSWCCSRKPASRMSPTPPPAPAERGPYRKALPRRLELFQEIEAAGGLAAALEQGLIQSQSRGGKLGARTRTRRQKGSADRRQRISRRCGCAGARRAARRAPRPSTPRRRASRSCRCGWRRHLRSRCDTIAKIAGGKTNAEPSIRRRTGERRRFTRGA